MTLIPVSHVDDSEFSRLDIATFSPGEERYLTHQVIARDGRRINRVLYKYCHTDGDVFSIEGPNLKTARKQRDIWLSRRFSRL